MWKLFRIIELIINHFYSNILLRFVGVRCNFSSIIYCPTRMIDPTKLDIGKKAVIYRNSYIWLDNKDSRLKIGDRSQIGASSHITAMSEMVIEENVIIADRVYITDFNHKFDDINIPIRDQGLSFVNKVVIGKNSWIGENVSIIGAKVGSHSIIGSNSVVTKDIPSYSVAVGIPAKVIKQYDFATKEWKSVNR